MKIGVIGAGALGSLLAALLSQAAAKFQDEVSLIGSPASFVHLEIIKNRGLKVTLAEGLSNKFGSWGYIKSGSIKNLKVQILTSYADIEPVDLALIVVKSYRSGDAAILAKNLLVREGVGLTLQNGLGNLEILAAEVGQDRACQGVTALGANLTEPGELFWTGAGPTSIGIPSWLGPFRQNLLQGLVDRFRFLALEVGIYQNIEGMVWGKLAVNCGINPVASLLNVTNGELLKYPDAVAIMNEAALETASLARSLGIILPYPYNQAPIEARKIASLTALNINSMLADLRRGKQTEIAAINGAVVREAEKLGLQTPVNWSLARLVKALEKTGISNK